MKCRYVGHKYMHFMTPNNDSNSSLVESFDRMVRTWVHRSGVLQVMQRGRGDDTVADEWLRMIGGAWVGLRCRSG
jgi:hypothetical protein